MPRSAGRLMISRDALLHIPMTGLFWAVLLALVLLLPVILATAAAACLLTLFREVSQAQQRFGDDFRMGWAFWRWGPQKTGEWLLPTVAIMACAGALQVFWGR